MQQINPLKFVPNWSESVVGVVMSGYVRDQHGGIVYNGLKVILESTYVFDIIGRWMQIQGFSRYL
ncbi:hypothetical protein [Methanohalophilus sp.]